MYLQDHLPTPSNPAIFPMQVILDIPDTPAEQLPAAGKDPARAALEALAAD